MFRCVFGEEKASVVWGTMSQYVKCHKMFINNDQRLLEELRRLELKLSDNLSTLRNSLLLAGQMNTHGFKIWVNGAFFHLKMMVHEARLNIKTSQKESHYVDSINAAVTLYLQERDNLLKKYNTYKISITTRHSEMTCLTDDCVSSEHLKNTELNCIHKVDDNLRFRISHIIEPFVNQIFSKYKPITSLKKQFLNFKDNFNSLIHQHDAFTLGSYKTILNLINADVWLWINHPSLYNVININSAFTNCRISSVGNRYRKLAFLLECRNCVLLCTYYHTTTTCCRTMQLVRL